MLCVLSVFIYSNDRNVNGRDLILVVSDLFFSLFLSGVVFNFFFLGLVYALGLCFLFFSLLLLRTHRLQVAVFGRKKNISYEYIWMCARIIIINNNNCADGHNRAPQTHNIIVLISHTRTTRRTLLAKPQKSTTTIEAYVYDIE